MSAEPKWYQIVAFNAEPHFGFGYLSQAEHYCDHLNKNREINLYAAHEISNPELIHALEHTRNDGFNLDEALAEIAEAAQLED